MESKIAVLELNKITKQRNVAIIVGALILIILLLQMIVIFRQDRAVILVPSFLSDEAGLSSKKASITYLENITRDVINVMLDVTPDNVNYSSQQILKITHPAFYGKLKQQLNQRVEDITSRRITTNFYPKSMIANSANNQVFVSGKLLTFLGTKMVLEEEKTYSVSYEYNNFKLLIVDFHKVDLTKKMEEDA